MQHLNDMMEFVELAKSEKIALILVLFPEPQEALIDYCQEYINLPIENFFKERNLPVLNTYELFKSFPEEKRIVNWTDAHPSVILHKAIGEKLAETAEGKILIPTD